eukprot:TRINITY_DN235_c0_g1_i5.p1 TRINITY_DN235_c0_g1~~TRINITY_DN235_c0_g1_i5.p1  ORF type:complete len:426 (-),score=64.16 TRINITY_DN235_c0_g1_i5:364-1641(-)
MGSAFSRDTDETTSCRLFLDQPTTSLTSQSSVQPIFAAELHDYKYSSAKLNLLCVTSDSKLLFVASKESVIVFELSTIKPFLERVVTIKLRSTINQLRCVENHVNLAATGEKTARDEQSSSILNSAGSLLLPLTTSSTSCSIPSGSFGSFSTPSFMSSASFDSIPNHSLLCVTDGGDVVVFHIDTTIRKSPVVSSALYRCDESAWCGTLRNNRIFVSANSKQIHIWPAEPVEGEAGQNLLGSEKHSWKLSGHVHNIPSFDINKEGTRLVSSSIDHSIKIWDLESNDCIRSANPIDDRGWSCKYIPASSVHSDQLNYDNKAELISAIRGGTEEIILYGSVDDLFLLSPALSILAHIQDPFSAPEQQESSDEHETEDSACCLVEYFRSFDAINGLAFLEYIPELSLAIVASPSRHRVSFVNCSEKGL